MRPGAAAKHFNPRSPCGERRACVYGFPIACIYFNPRSPCGERQVVIADDWDLTMISIHALLAESDIHDIKTANTKLCNFNPRSPCGERRHAERGNAPTILIISIHALLAESDVCTPAALIHSWPISIHALLAESDQASSPRTYRTQPFQSTLSLRRATGDVIKYYKQLANDFNPRSPCGERPLLRYSVSV